MVVSCYKSRDVPEPQDPVQQRQKTYTAVGICLFRKPKQRKKPDDRSKSAKAEDLIPVE